jgi:hypothetical protein
VSTRTAIRATIFRVLRIDLRIEPSQFRGPSVPQTNKINDNNARTECGGVHSRDRPRRQ